MSSEENQETMFPKKWAKIIKDLPEFKDTADAASPEDLKKIMVMSAGNIYNIEKEKAADTKLNAAKELIKEFNAPYRESMNLQTAKIKYALFLLEGKGAKVGG